MIFNKKESIKNIHILSADFAKTTPSNSDDEYIWVDIYKGTDSEMNCMNDFHYELDHIYTIEDEKELTVCGHGFNCCLKLSDVFNYKPFSFVNPNRYFKGKALVLAKDYEQYGHSIYNGYGMEQINKIVAKSIILTEEVSIEELYKNFNYKIIKDSQIFVLSANFDFFLIKISLLKILSIVLKTKLNI